MTSTPWGAMRAGTAKSTSSGPSRTAGTGGAGASSGTRADTNAVRAAAEGRYRWGSGQRLGGEGL